VNTDSVIRAPYLKLIGPDFSFLSQFLCHMTLKFAVSRSRPSVPYGANLSLYIIYIAYSYSLLVNFILILKCEETSG